MRTTVLVIHIPKTAGTTLRAFLDSRHTPGQVLGLYRETIDDGPALRKELNHPQVRLVIGHFHFGLHRLLSSECRYTTFVRNPINQVVSHFNYMASSVVPSHVELMAACNRSLEGFLELPCARNLQTQYITGLTTGQIEDRPQAAIAAVSRQLQEAFQFVGLAERFAESLYLLCEEIGCRPHFYHSVNRADSKQQLIRSDELSPAQRRQIEAVNFCDVEAVRVATELFEYRLNRLPLKGLAARAFRASNTLAVRAEQFARQLPKPCYSFVPRRIRQGIIAALPGAAHARAA